MKPITYLDNNGYCIKISSISKELLNKTINELTVIPHKIGITKEELQKLKFKLYLFDNKKEYIIVPKYYGISRFGNPVNTNYDAEEIDISFTKELREKQKVLCDNSIKYMLKHGGGVISIPCGGGKCLSKGTPILMHDGSIKKVEDVKVGDKLMGDDSKPRNVLSLARGREEMYDVIPTKGAKYTVNKSHILSLKYNTVKPSGINGSGHTKVFNKGDIVDIEVTNYLKLSKYYHGKGSPLRGYRAKVDFKPQKVDLDPYMLGYWLGDGTITTSQITTEDEEVVNYFKQECVKHDLLLKQGKITKKHRGDLKYSITTGSYDKNSDNWSNNCSKDNYFYQQLDKLNVLNNKHFPEIYKCNSREVRLQVLAGFIDADGHNSNNCFDICLSSERLIDDIIFIARSLGLAGYKKECWKICTNAKNGPKKCKCYRTNIHGNTDIIPTKIKRKQCTERKQIKDVTVYGIKLKSVGIGDYYGFEIDGNKRFLLGDFTVTHNTVCGLYIASIIGVKTLVVVNKSFLLDQWKERAKEFLNITDDNIGIIRQKKCNIENKDIVIGTIQTISKKNYDFYKLFGLVIYDEAHHVASKFFSRCLLKTSSQYTLSLTATPYRGDGLIKVMYWFSGGTIYREKIKINKNVIAKMIYYKSNDKLFKLKKRWINGKLSPDSMTMSRNMCKIKDRNKIIINIIDELRRNQPERKILILSLLIDHVKNIKKEIDNRIDNDIKRGILEENEINSCLYIGSTKPKDRNKVEESGDIIFSTYSMAQEALDIKHLNTIILTSPKKDVVQSIGRVMRKILQSGDVRPMIIDICDDLNGISHWINIRKKLYKECKYEIHNFYAKNNKFMTSNEYDGNKLNDNKIHNKNIFIHRLINEYNKDMNERNKELIKIRKIYQKINLKTNIKNKKLLKIFRTRKEKFKVFDDLEYTDLRDILFVPKLTDKDFDIDIVKDNTNKDTINIKDDEIDLNDDDTISENYNKNNYKKKYVKNNNKNLSIKRLF
jgi:superfamily II DNA or RNA helicase